MRQIFSGLVAAVAVMAAAPAMACGYNPCWQPQAYVAPAPTYSYSGCNPCGGWAHERLADPEQQYYYVNQGPTYTGPGNWAPSPTYQEDSVSGWNGYSRSHYYGYRAHRHYGYAPRTSYYHAPRMNHHYGYAPRHAYAPRYAPAPSYYGHRVLRRYY
jgi:hypothetical protein